MAWHLCEPRQEQHQQLRSNRMKNMYRYLMLSLVFFVSSCEAETTDIFSEEYSVCTVAYNYNLRSINKYKILEGTSCVGSAHGRVPGDAYGGGAYVCSCSIKRHKFVTVEWKDAISHAEALEGKKALTHRAKAILPPPQSSTSHYLQIHFLTGEHVTLDWLDNQGVSRVDPISGKIK